MIYLYYFEVFSDSFQEWEADPLNICLQNNSEEPLFPYLYSYEANQFKTAHNISCDTIVKALRINKTYQEEGYKFNHFYVEDIEEFLKYANIEEKDFLYGYLDLLNSEGLSKVRTVIICLDGEEKTTED